MRRFRRRPIVRRRKARIMMPKTMIPETKYLTLNDVSKAIKNNSYNATVSYLDGFNNYYTDLLGNITKGTDDNQRVGDRIFVKFITFHFFIQSCGEAVSPDPIYNYITRAFVHNSRTTAGTNIPNFYRGASVSPLTHLKPDRRNYTIWYDKFYQMINYTGPNAATIRGAGPQRLIKFKLPVYRNVGFDSAGVTKDDNNVYSVSLGGFNLAGATNTFKQMGCMDVCIRVYFTDS